MYPREVEDALLAHPAMLECAVVGAPHEKWVEAATSFVVLRSEKTAREDELIEFTRERLASYEVPKSVQFIAQIPKSAVRKVLRRALAQPAVEGRPESWMSY